MSKIDSCKELLNLFMNCTKIETMACIYGLNKSTCYFNNLKCEYSNEHMDDMNKLIENNSIKKISMKSEVFLDYSGHFLIEDGFFIQKTNK